MNDSLTICTFDHLHILHDACTQQVHDTSPSTSLNHGITLPVHIPLGPSSPCFSLNTCFFPAPPALFFVAFIVLFIHYSYPGLSTFLYLLINPFVFSFSALSPFCKTSHRCHMSSECDGGFNSKYISTLFLRIALWLIVACCI